MIIAETLQNYKRVRILFGDDASAKERLQLMRQLRARSDEDLLKQRETMPLLSSLRNVERLFQEGRIEARCYTKLKFHAKSYLFLRPAYPQHMGIIGSGNFTRPGLTQNVELNVELTTEQTSQLARWYEERWQEAVQDNVTEGLLEEIRRQIDLYDPYIIYLKALYLWGQSGQSSLSHDNNPLLQILDPHQQVGYRQALKMLERQNGVMVCDGVGLGKSFIALALMTQLCRQGKNVLLIAPKNILTNSWIDYFKVYLRQYQEPFGNLCSMAMTEFGYDPEEGNPEEQTEAEKKRYELARSLGERADVVVIDESHNFRTSSSKRYQNLFQILRPREEKPKQVILLTATPVNTHYLDIAAQIALITHENGSIGGYKISQIRRFAQEMDSTGPAIDPMGQLGLVFECTDTKLERVLEQTLIQRSRSTCKELAEASGKKLRFPKRNDPQVLEYDITEPTFSEMLKITKERFQPGVELISSLREELKSFKELTEDQKNRLIKRISKKTKSGLRLSAFLTEQYRLETKPGSKQYQDEVRLAALVFANTLKQLESSPPAFQGMIQSLGTGLVARLKHIFGESVELEIQPHLDWTQEPLLMNLNTDFEEGEEGEVDPAEGETIDQSGEEIDDWLDHAIRQRGLTKKLKDFTSDTHDFARWRSDILEDLQYLKEIHQAILKARQTPDAKLERIKELMKELLDEGKKVLLFTQSQRTALYLEQELRAAFPKKNIARIDSRVSKTRAAILYAFCPGYNPRATAPSVPSPIDLLISTDVLSEGVNLQEADAIVNYDIHWNPVRLIQRIGRVDRRLNPDITPNERAFDIYNVLPPDEIEETIKLVAAVEGRVIKISRAVGLDQAVLKSTDPADTLKEFNKYYEGEVTQTDHALTQFIQKFNEPDNEMIKVLEQLPLGAFGVWTGAPEAGLFAMFTVQASAGASEQDRQRFGNVEGKPVLVMELENGSVIRDAGVILNTLSQAPQGTRSGTPSDEAELQARLKKLREKARQEFAEIGLPSTYRLQLVCWMEMKP